MPALLREAAGGATVALSNVRGPPAALTLCGARVDACGFVPPPPGVPVGVGLASVGGALTLTVNADARAIPDARAFLGRVLDEYDALRDSAGLPPPAATRAPPEARARAAEAA